MEENERIKKDFLDIGISIGKEAGEKNVAYGSAILNTGRFLEILFPDGIQPNQYDDVGLLVRIFDKQMRIANSINAFGENPFRDIAGYGIGGVYKGQINKEASEIEDDIEGVPIFTKENISQFMQEGIKEYKKEKPINKDLEKAIKESNERLKLIPKEN